MTSINISFNESELLAVKAMMVGITNGYEKVMTSTINETLAKSKTKASQEIGKVLNLKAARIKQDLKVDKANYTYITGRLEARGKRIGLMTYDAKQLKMGVSTKIYKNEPRQKWKHAFIAPGKKTPNDTQKDQVYWREWDKFRVKPRNINYQNLAKKYRYKIIRLAGPAIEDVYADPRVFNIVMAFINTEKYVILSRRLSYELRKYA